MSLYKIDLSRQGFIDTLTELEIDEELEIGKSIIIRNEYGVPLVATKTISGITYNLITDTTLMGKSIPEFPAIEPTGDTYYALTTIVSNNEYVFEWKLIDPSNFGTSGTSGSTGTSGTSGSTGTSGTSGSTGTSGTSGTAGYSMNEIFNFSQPIEDTTYTGATIQFYVDNNSGLITSAGKIYWKLSTDTVYGGGITITNIGSTYLYQTVNSTVFNNDGGTTKTINAYCAITLDSGVVLTKVKTFKVYKS